MKSYLKSFMNRDAATQFVKVGMVGVLNTILYFVLFNIFREFGIGLVASVTLAFAAATLFSYLVNRRWTFRIVSASPSIAEGSKFYVVNIVAWAVTVAVVLAADWLFGPLSRLGENIANVVAAGLILLPKFASYRDLVFRRSIDAEAKNGNSGGNTLAGADSQG